MAAFSKSPIVFDELTAADIAMFQGVDIFDFDAYDPDRDEGDPSVEPAVIARNLPTTYKNAKSASLVHDLFGYTLFFIASTGKVLAMHRVENEGEDITLNFPINIAEMPDWLEFMTGA